MSERKHPKDVIVLILLVMTCFLIGVVGARQHSTSFADKDGSFDLQE